jgi:hypothetical protein
MLIPVIKVKDKAHDGYIHIIGTNSHDALIAYKDRLEYYNLQNGCGSYGNDEYGYEFVGEESEYLPFIEFVTLEEWIKLSMKDIDNQTKWLIDFYKKYAERYQKKVQKAREDAGIVWDTGGEIIE